MNVREGMRRLGLVVGMLGAGAGAVVGYSQLQPLLKQRGQYNRFQALVSSSTVKRELELLNVIPTLPALDAQILEAKQDGYSDDDIVGYLRNARPELAPKISEARRQGYSSADILGQLAPRAAQAVPAAGDTDADIAAHDTRHGPPVLTDADIEAHDRFQRALSGLDGWKVNKGGVRAIHFWKGTEETRRTRLAGNVGAADISAIETDDGQEVDRTAPPRFWSYLLTSVFPLLGFLLPWGGIKTLTWIGTGFFQPDKRNPPHAGE